VPSTANRHDVIGVPSADTRANCPNLAVANLRPSCGSSFVGADRTKSIWLFSCLFSPCGRASQELCLESVVEGVGMGDEGVALLIPVSPRLMTTCLLSGLEAS
jgi:hypothetical protein